MDFTQAFAAIWDALPYLLSGIWWTIGLVFSAMLLGLCIGVPMAVGQVYGSRPVKRFVSFYVWLFRGIPILVMLYLFYFGILAYLTEIFPVLRVIGLDTAFAAAVIVLGLTTGSYQSQIFRGAIQALPEGQMKAALALGMSERTAIWTIVLPQAMRMAIPGWSNEYSIILKDSALAFVIGVAELMSRTRSVASTTHQPLPLALFAGALFLVLTWVGLKMLRRLENKVRIPGYSREGSF
ncbi:amino acid ABC transporter permease [Desulfobaculum bizertense]|uniref:Amino acid ABC transporter membrane protein 1, PAAT family (TC 3.A.1.3.-) n=1 Tax=Desulfobaculum bizertense DSM 18034 TaxID=1121442 RepID=A0A1T4WZZ7_9BACT|nr:amino acid ABC transporter permease [Desulfobaculum bizertense]UIJ37355.1 amino acid ABC transporter permease [Desulfobaculum bizertense]SKA82809.1 amino acid ABC transporter membrane protein 1, PAAT family (TC 3.A.1.3.-) [Desulfobaculum bizertense DSM 18034]